MIYTFWEGYMPEYIKLCIKSWKQDYILLNYDNLSKYTDIPNIDKLNKFTLPQIADIVRVHVLRDNGGYWLDADTIMITDKLPKENMIGYPERRLTTIGYLYADKPNMDMFNRWAEYQQTCITTDVPLTWNVVGNMFVDRYLGADKDITIAPVENCWAETYMISDDIPRRLKYLEFYFRTAYHLEDLKPTNMLMLHNSWTPQMYKELGFMNTIEQRCTLSNILREVNGINAKF